MGQLIILRLTIFGLLLTLPQWSLAGKANQIIRVGAYDNPPKIALEEKGMVTGFWPDLIEYIGRREHWEIQYVRGTWADCMRKLENGEIDILPDVAYTEKRARRFIFSADPIIVSWSRVYVHKDNRVIQSIEDLKQKKIAALRGSVNFQGAGGFRELSEKFDLNCTFIELDSYDNVFKAVENRIADAGITNRNFGNKFAKNYTVRETPIVFQPIDMKFAFNKSNPLTPLLVSTINRQIKDIKNDDHSVYYQLLSKYFEGEIAERKNIPDWVVTLLEVLAFLLVSFFIITLISRIEVKRKIALINLKDQNLIRSSRKYREIFNATSDAIILHDGETGRILDVNTSMLKMYGYSKEELPSISMENLSSGESPFDKTHGNEKLQLAKTEGEQTFLWRAKRKNGQLFWVEVALKYTDIGGVGHYIAAIRDIQQRKEAEDALAAEKERLAVTLASIGDGVIATDIGGKVVLLNQVAEKLTGWSQREAVGRKLEEIFDIRNEKSGESCKNPVQQVMASGNIIELTNPTLLVARDGTKRPIGDSGAPIRDKQGNLLGVILVFRDLTTKIKSESELLKIRKLESISVLAGGLAHDFNNLLSSILGNISLLKAGIRPDDKNFKLLDEAERATLRATGLTQQLLTFSKGGEPLKEITSIENIIRETTDFILSGSGIQCRYNFDADLFPIEIDAGQISQVIQNIISNAKQAMPGGGLIVLTCKNHISEQEKFLTPGKYVSIRIRDYGPGIAAEIIDKIFDPFFSTKTSGSGLGLAISDSIIKKHNGYIKVSSVPGEGTEFKIYLPAAASSTINPEPQPAKTATLSDLKILIMDDEPVIRNVVKAMLERLGCQVILSNDGAEAVQLYSDSLKADKPIDILIMDLTIPGGMGGKTAVEAVHKLNPDAVVIVSSGYSNDPVMANYSKYGFAAAIAKPFRFGDLKSVLTEVINNNLRS
ncbi:MAG: PAS domain S-box protein [FCB group bacterium]|nr:PAS domain S-box protein [FCB group bacterium]